MDVAAYRRRIGDTGDRSPTLATLKRLHRSHLYAVPFENLDVHLGRPIVLSLSALFDKVVGQRRGGFCYELNSLFGWLLRELGYTVDLLSARVFSHGVPGPPFDHLLLRVQLAEPWLADVGYGDSFIEPLPLREEEHTQAGYRYRLELGEPEGVLWRRSPTTDWDAQYTFSLEPHQLNEFQDMCHHHQTSPDSPFTQKALCSLATPDGRKTLSGNRFIHTRQGQRSLRKIADAADYRALLHQQFGIDLSVAEVAALLPTFHSSP